MHKYGLASHNTMSYGKPRNPLLRPFHFVARCQNISIEEQYEKYGVRMFDLRVKFNRKAQKWFFAHGFMEFGEDIDRTLKYLDSRDECVYVRLILEYNRPAKEMDGIVRKFVDTFGSGRHSWRNIIFFEYRRKYDWKQLFSYEGMPAPEIYQAVSSMTGSKIDDWFPALYARLHNRDILRQGTSADWLMMDFVGW